MGIDREDINRIAKATADEVSIKLRGQPTGRWAPYIHETRRIGDRLVKKTSVAATDLIVYDVWEPSALMGKHSTITSIDGEWYGRIGTRHLPLAIEKLLGGSEERIQAVGKWHEDQYEEAYRLILEAFPEARGGRRSMGEITLHWSP